MAPAGPDRNNSDSPGSGEDSEFHIFKEIVIEECQAGTTGLKKTNSWEGSQKTVGSVRVNLDYCSSTMSFSSVKIFN